MEKKSKGKKKRGKSILVYLFIASVLVLAGIIYLLPTVADALTKTWVIEYGSIQVTDQVTCCFVRDETLVKAEGAGSIQYYFDEGTKVRKGTKILDITPGGGGYTALENSTVSYYSDGLEDSFTPETMTELSRKKVDELEAEMTSVKRENAAAGEPVYKLVDTTQWYVTFWVEAENIAKYEQGKSVVLELPLGRVRGTTHQILDDGDAFQVILKFNRYYEDVCKIRKTDAQVITSDYEGLRVRNGSITTEDGQPGVYVKNLSGDYVFTPVSVITTDGEYSLLESTYFYKKKEDGTSDKISTVQAYDEILNSPGKPE